MTETNRETVADKCTCDYHAQLKKESVTFKPLVDSLCGTFKGDDPGFDERRFREAVVVDGLVPTLITMSRSSDTGVGCWDVTIPVEVKSRFNIA